MTSTVPITVGLALIPRWRCALCLPGLLLGIVHDRRLMREAQANVAIRWLIGYGLHEVLPDHSSLTRIRQRWGAERFRRIFQRTVHAPHVKKVVIATTIGSTIDDRQICDVPGSTRTTTSIGLSPFWNGITGEWLICFVSRFRSEGLNSTSPPHTSLPGRPA